jgi:signal transduction histidine kinase
MALSRLRLRLAGGFALAFALGLGLLAAGALGYLWREAGRRLETRLGTVADGVARAVAREINDAPDSSFAFAANEVVKEWPANDDTFGIADERGVLVAGINRAKALDPVMGAWARAPGTTHFSVSHGGQDYRAVAVPAVYPGTRRTWRYGIVAFGSTEGIERDAELLGGGLAIAAPLIVLLSLAGGYVLARRALAPVGELRASIAGIAPSDLSRRLPTGGAADEISALAAEFNSLLERLDEAQRRNRGFVREAAHQIRTPLTLVLGEAGHALGATAPDADRMRTTLVRIRSAAEQMRRRVDELFLLAEAQAGEQVRLDDDVELDGLVLECTDLMRRRASDLGRTLAIGKAEHVVVRGNEALLKEALVELLENGCRHGKAGGTVTVSDYAGTNMAIIEVESAGEPFGLPSRDPSEKPEGLGLPIVEWIARAHGGGLRLARNGEINVLTLELQRGAASLRGERRGQEGS